MILLLLRVLEAHGYYGLGALGFLSTRMLLAALTALLFTFLVGPLFIKKLYELKTGQQSIRVEDCPVLVKLHEKKKDTPTMGGVLILTAMSLSLVLWMDLRSVYTWILLFTSLSLGGIGARDDYLKLKYKNCKGLSSKKKMLLQLAVAGLVALYLLVPSVAQVVHSVTSLVPPMVREGSVALSMQDYMGLYYVPFIKHPVAMLTGTGLIFSFLWLLFVTTGSSNAANLTDGLDGLAAGCLVLVGGGLAMVAFFSNHLGLANYLHLLYIEGSGEIAIYLSAMVGSLIAFLWYNGYPAQVFMGDTGSLALGGVIGISALLLRREGLLAIMGGVLVLEAVSVILQVGSYRLRNKKRIFLCTPIHHHFECLGWPETKVVLRFWIFGLILAMVGLISLKLQF